MNESIFQFLANHEVCSLTTLLPDGSPHGAALHFSYNTSPVELYFLTKNTSRKTKGLLNGQKGRAAVVVGFSDEESITLQMDGEVAAITVGSEFNDLQRIHLKKHPNQEKYIGNPAYIFLKFMPWWWRYTDYNTKPVTILSSEGSY
jgi:general stress protein 26